jgi:hypothetical protein
MTFSTLEFKNNYWLGDLQCNDLDFPYSFPNAALYARTVTLWVLQIERE